MANIEDDPFFSERVAKAVSACINEREDLNIISPVELKIVRRADRVRTLNSDLDGQLLTRLHNWRETISASDALEILLDASQVRVIPLVTELLDTAVSLELRINLETAYTALEKAQEEEIPASWILMMMNDELEEPTDAEPESNSFSINSL